MPFEHSDDLFDAIRYTFKLDNVEENGDTKTYTFKSTDGSDCEYIRSVRSASNRKKLDEAIKELNDIYDEDKFLIYGDLYKVLGLKHKKDMEWNKFWCGNYSLYCNAVKEMIGDEEDKLTGIEANMNGLQKQYTHFKELYEREKDKLAQREVLIAQLRQLIDDEGDEE